MAEQPNVTNSMGALAADEKATPVMIYTSDALIWGQVITKGNLLASRVLIGATVPDFVTLLDAQLMATGGGRMGAPKKFGEIHIPVPTIQAYHLMPPHSDPLDYDENEPNRIMVPLLAYVSGFQFKVEARISTATTLKSFLDVSKSKFLSFYNANISHPNSPQMKPIQTQMVLVRREGTVFAD